MTGRPPNLGNRFFGSFAVAVAALALAACSSSPSASTSSTSSPSGGGTTATTTASTGGGSSFASRLGSLSNSMKGAETAPFKATYSATDNGKMETITYEQDPPKFLFGTTAGEVVDTGSTTYFCSTTGAASCFSSSTEDPLAALLQALSPKTYIGSLQAAQAALAAKTAGYSTSFSNQTFAGQPSTCVTISQSSGTEKVCVTGTGELAYVSTSPAQVFALTGYSASVSASDFSLPPGASVVTIPTGITVPS
jgi:hypothetical protein